MSAEPTPRWQGVVATALGASHLRSGLPNQDAVDVVTVPGGLIAVVADGHGGSRYVRSDQGSALAVAAATIAGGEAMTRLGTDPATTDLVRELTDTVPLALVGAWRISVTEHHRAHPFNDEERARGAADLDVDPHVSYGATVVLALLGDNWAGLLQIGDGDLTIVFNDGRVEAPVPGDDRLVGGETTSLCLPTAVSDARVAILREPLPALVVLTSDGYANSFADPAWRAEAGTGLREALERDGLDAVATQLPSWLADSAVASGDDVSMALIRRVGAPGAAPVSPGDSLRSTSPHRRGSWKWRSGVVGAALAVLASCALGGWFLGRSSESASGATTTTESPTVVPETTTTTTLARIADAVIIVNNKVIAFSNDPASASPRLVARVDRPNDNSVDQLRILSGGRLQWRRSPTDRFTDIQSGVGAAVTVNDTIWLANPEGSTLWTIDPATRKEGLRFTVDEPPEVTGPLAPQKPASATPPSRTSLPGSPPSINFVPPSDQLTPGN